MTKCNERSGCVARPHAAIRLRRKRQRRFPGMSLAASYECPNDHVSRADVRASRTIVARYLARFERIARLSFCVAILRADARRRYLCPSSDSGGNHIDG